MQSFPFIKFLYSNLHTDNTKSCSMESTHEILTRLKFIGLIKKDEKISVKHMTVHQTSILTSLWRMFHKETRESTLDFLTSTINRGFEIISLCLVSTKSSEQIICKNLIEDLIKSSSGLINLQSTYSEDRLFWCHIQTLIQAIEVKLNELKENHPNLFTTTKTTDKEALSDDEIKFIS